MVPVFMALEIGGCNQQSSTNNRTTRLSFPSYLFLLVVDIPGGGGGIIIDDDEDDNNLGGRRGIDNNCSEAHRKKRASR